MDDHTPKASSAKNLPKKYRYLLQDIYKSISKEACKAHVARIKVRNLDEDEEKKHRTDWDGKLFWHFFCSILDSKESRKSALNARKKIDSDTPALGTLSMIASNGLTDDQSKKYNLRCCRLQERIGI